MEELRLTLRVFTMIAVGYAVAVHLAADNLYRWLDVRPPDPVDWLSMAVGRWL